MRMQQQQPKKPSRTVRRTFGWLAIVAYILAVIAAVPAPHASLLFGILTAVAFISFFLWVAATVDYRRATTPPKRRATAEDVYLEQEHLRLQAARDAGAEAARVVSQAPDQVGGMPVLGIVIRDEAHLQAPTLLPELARRDRLRRILIALAGRPPYR